MASDSPDAEAIARGVFAKIAARFPSLQMVEEAQDPVQISITIPVQPGLRHKVWLCLQNHDELHFSVGHFWLEWFPCTDPGRVEAYVDAIVGFLSGTHRILEHYRGRRCVKAELQVPEAGQWRTIGTWSSLWLPIPWTKSYQELRNA